ncbi:MAG: DUF4105 domain-containing protein [Trueperaceae bacterium]|nr:DUF4105 domain-containing protein [Trueperaceae bacterium]
MTPAAPWKPDVARLPSATLDGSRVTIDNVRATRYPAPGQPYQVRWETRRFDLTRLQRLWFLVEPFHPRIPVIAHTFLSFEFSDDFLALSVEARLRQDQRYSILQGLLGRYGLTYSFGDERDFFLRRTRYQGHELYLYPMVTPPLEVRALFLNMLASANALLERPRRYHSVRHNCTSILRQHANQVRPGSFPPFILADVMPGRSDRVLYRKGWIDTDVPEDQLRERHAVRDAANAAADDPDFSRRMRAT